MAFKFKKVRSPVKISLPSLEKRKDVVEEPLSGMVNGMEASAPEEMLAKALKKAGIPFMFRYVVGAPKGMPGWKELDFLASHGGVVYAMEVDTAFTHRNKQNSDVLHDAIVLNDSNIQALGTVFPQVIHVDGDSDLANSANAKNYVSRQFGKG